MSGFPLRAAIIAVCCFGLVSAYAEGGTSPGMRVAVKGGKAPSLLDQVLAQAGAQMAGTSSEADVLILDSTATLGASEADQITELLRRGGSLIVSLPRKTEKLAPLSSLLPVNLWSAQEDSYRRGATGALAPEGSPFAQALQTPGFALPDRFDLHLPYSTMEAGQHRYDWERMGKPLLNTDWQVLLSSDQAGKLPLLVEGRTFGGRVFVFAGDLFAPELTAWSGYSAFLHALLGAARPVPTVGDVAARALKLSVPLHQERGALTVEVENPTKQAVPATLLVKVRNLVNGLMNSQSVDLTVPAGKKIAVPVSATSALLNSDVAPRSSDPGTATLRAGAAFLRIEAGISSQARDEIYGSVNAVVDQTPPLTLEMASDDVRKFRDRDGWPAGGVNFLDGSGMPLDRYVYFCGETPKVTVRVRNALHNIAPLAAASDLGWPENPTTQGLNDGAVSYGDVRGKFNVFGYWAGRSAPEQRIRLTWPQTVTLAGERLLVQSSYRNWNRTNPRNYVLETAGSSEAAVSVEKASYEFWQREDFFAPRKTEYCTLTMTGVDGSANLEPKPFRSTPDFKDTPINSALGEWEIFGWPGVQVPPAVAGTLRIILHDLTEDRESVLVEKEITLDPLTEKLFEVEVPTRKSFGQVVVRSEFRVGTETKVAATQPVLFVTPDKAHLIPRSELGEEIGLLCSPGFIILEEFGKGTVEDTQGWGGPDDKVWAWSHDLMEIGVNNPESARRFFLSPVGLSHYTNPWRDFPSGRYVWEWATDRLIERFKQGESKGKKSVHVGFSDRWNGVPINNSFAWADIVRFDEYLRFRGQPGLKERTRKDLAREITTEHSDTYQVFQLDRYADELLKCQQRLADAGISFTVETHGSFPLAGGELGAKLGKTHKAVGTDLFWELRDEDLYKSIGYRFGVVSANPDLESGAYNQWGWISGALANPTWFAPSGEVEPSRRQWYSTYWAGRVTSDGQFSPYSIYGFSLQGGYGAKNTPEDWRQFNRVQSLMIHARPERATGFGLVASWQLQENRMGPESGRLGFGLYAGKGYEQVDQLAGELYQRLTSRGVPVSFVASTYTLKKWNGTQPLVVVDGFETDPWEVAELDRLNRAGAPLIVVGSENRAGRTEAEALFGVKKTETGWQAQEGTQVVANEKGEPFAFISRRSGRAPTLFCPSPIKELGNQESNLLSKLCLDLCGDPLEVPPGVAATSFLHDGSLLLALGDQGDQARTLDIAVRPAFFDAAFQGVNFRVIDLDRAVVIPTRWENGVLHFQIPCAPNDGRLLQILPTPSNS